MVFIVNVTSSEKKAYDMSYGKCIKPKPGKSKTELPPFYESWSAELHNTGYIKKHCRIWDTLGRSKYTIQK